MRNHLSLRRIRRRRKILAGLVLAGLTVPCPLGGIVRRHDLADREYLELGRRAPAVITFPAGSGTLISAEWILTAAHVAAHVSAGSEVQVGERTYQVLEIRPHPGWKTPQTRSTDDIALLRLSPPVEGIEPVPLHRGRREAGRRVLFFGRGATGTGRDGVTVEDGAMRGATNTVRSSEPRWLTFRFDGPPEATDREGISGPGDSGGPALIEEDGRLELAGVSSWQDRRGRAREGFYGVLEHYARVSSYAAWIDSVTGPEPESPRQRTRVLLHAEVFDGRRPKPLRDAAILIRGRRIEAVVESFDPGDASFDEVIDAGGRAVIPGLIDSHVHVLDRLARNETDESASPDRPGFDLRPWLAAGVTTLVDVASQRESLAHRPPPAGPRTSPRVLATGPILTAPGGYPFVGWDGAPGWPVTSPAEIRGAVNVLAAAGVDLIKVSIEAGFQQELGTDETWPVLKPAEIREIVAAARLHELEVRAHLTQASELEMALATGVTGALHVPLGKLPEEFVERAVDSGFLFVSTARMWQPDPAVFETVCRNVRAILAAGGRVIAGTDAPTFYKERGLVRELERLAECGFEPRRALVAATRWPGESLAPRWDLGTLEPGQLADLVVLDGRPWSTLEDLRDPQLVLIEGEVVYRRPATGAVGPTLRRD